MKSFKVLLVMVAVLALVPLGARAENLQAYKEMVEGLNAEQAVALANQWKWTQNSIKTYVDPQEVVFEFPDKTVKKVPLPEDKMVVAIAPYIYSTHG